MAAFANQKRNLVIYLNPFEAWNVECVPLGCLSGSAKRRESLGRGERAGAQQEAGRERPPSGMVNSRGRKRYVGEQRERVGGTRSF